MKKLLSIIMAGLMLLSLCACSAGNTTPPAANSPEEVTAAPTAEPTEEPPKDVRETDYAKIEGIYSQTNYEDPDGKPLTMVYMGVIVKTPDKNLRVTSIGMKMTVNGVNTYSSDKYLHINYVTSFMPNYLYTRVMTDVYMGEEVKLLYTFKVPKAELEAGRRITFESSEIPDMDKISFDSASIIAFHSREIPGILDPLGNTEEIKLRGGAPETIEEYGVDLWLTSFPDYDDGRFYLAWSEGYPGTEYTFFANDTVYTIRFYHDDRDSFVVDTSIGISNGGTFKVTSGYVILTYDTNGEEVYIRYVVDKTKYTDPEHWYDCVTFYFVEAFDVMT